MDVTPTFDPLYHPLPPSIEGLLEFIEDIDTENPNHLTLEWIVNEIKNHSLSYVRIGYIAAKVKLCKLWDRAKKGVRFRSFQEWCEIALGRSHWQINRLIEAAQVVINLARAGFTFLPQNEAQARHLVKLSPDEQVEKWDEILRSFPHHRITASAIAEIVTGQTAKPYRIEIDSDTYETLARKATEAGLTPKELLKKLIEGSDLEPETNPEDLPEPAESEPADQAVVISQQQLERWESDLDALVSEYDARGQSLSNSS